MPRERFQDPTIKQNGNGSYYIKVWRDTIGPDGLTRKQQRVLLGSADIGMRGAKRAKKAVMDTVNKASYVIQSQIGFGEILKQYDERHIAKMSFTTQAMRRSVIKCHIEPAFAKLKMYEVTTIRIEQWLQQKRDSGLSWWFVTALKNIMTMIFHKAKQWKMFDDDSPTMGIYVGRQRLAREKRKLTDDQARHLLAALPGEIRLMVMVSLFCTVRVSELLGLQERHLDFSAGIIKIRLRYWGGNLDRTKTQTSERDVPMGYLAEPLKALCGGDAEHFVFRGAEGDSRHAGNILTRFIKPVAKKLGFWYPGFGFRSFRREAITAISAELGIGQAMKAAGHSGADMSLVYTLQDRAELSRAISDRQQSLMGETTGKPV